MNFYLATIIIVLLISSLVPTALAFKSAIKDKIKLEQSNLDGIFDLMGEQSFIREFARSIKHTLIAISLGTSLILPDSAGLIMFRNINAGIIIGICTIDSIVTVRFRKKYRKELAKLSLRKGDSYVDPV